MEKLKIKSAVGRYVIVEPFDKSTVLKTEETATVFRIISFGKESDRLQAGSGWCTRDEFEINDLIIVAPNTVEKTMMGNQEVWYVHDTDIIATVEK